MVLLFGSMGEIGQVAKKSLDENGVIAVLIDFPQNTLRDEAGYRRELMKSIQAYQPELVIPIGNTVAMSRLAPTLRKMFPGILIAVESSDKVELLDSKIKFYEYARQLALPLPHRYLAAEEVPCGQRVIFKKEVSFGGQGVRTPRGIDALRNLILHNSESPYLIEDFIEGQEFSVDAYRYGNTFYASTYECIKAHGTHPAAERIAASMPQLESCATRILEALDYNGICGFDFIVTEAGEHYMLEANPRLTGGLQTQIESGFNPLMMLVESLKPD